MASPQLFDGKVITVTGAARGIGLGIARYLAARGTTLALADNRANELETFQKKLIQEFPASTVTGTAVDVSKRDQVEDWIAETKKEFGKIDGCVNNAAVMSNIAPLTTATDEDWNRVIGVNLTGTFNCIRAQLNTIEDGGSIVNMSSMAGLFGVPGIGPYVVSKHGIIGLTKTAAKEAAAKSVRVNAVCPGTIETPMLHEFRIQAPDAADSLTAAQLLKRIGSVDEIAPMVGYLLGDESGFVTSSIFTIGGGWGA